MQYYAALLLLTFLSMALAADPTATLVVSVQRADNAAPIPSASIEIVGNSKPFTVNERGDAHLDALPPGVYSVQVHAAGYLDNAARQVVLAAGQTISLAIQLHPLPVVRETMAVTATGTLYSVQDAPVRTEVLTQEFVDRQIKTTLAEAFQASISGVRMEMNCQNCGFMQVRINGLEGPYTQILEDGLFGELAFRNGEPHFGVLPIRTVESGRECS